MAFTANVSGIILGIDVGSVTGNLLTRSPFLQMLETDFTTVFITDFKDSAILTFRDGSTQAIDVLFDDPTTTYNFQNPAEFNTVRPQIMVQESLLPDVIYHNMKIKVKGIQYFVEDYESNGVGVLTVYMRRH